MFDNAKQRNIFVFNKFFHENISCLIWFILYLFDYQQNMDIKKFRTEKGYTQKEFAEFCGVTERTVQNWEKGNTYPSLLKKYIELTEQDEKFSQEIKGNSNTAVAVSGTGNSVNSISERFISLLEQKDIQMNRLISLLEERKG